MLIDAQMLDLTTTTDEILNYLIKYYSTNETLKTKLLDLPRVTLVDINKKI